MAEVLLRGQDLLADVDAAEPPKGELSFWWLGQNGFIVKGGSTVLYLDPYLADPPGRRRTPPPLRPEEVTNATAFLCSHDHSDHVDRASLPKMLAASPEARLLVSHVVANRLERDGYPAARLTPIGDGETRIVGDAEVIGVRAAHEFFDHHPALGYPHLGFVVRLNGVCLFHAGDGVPWEGLVAAVSAHRPHGLFVPINGRDAERFRRGCLGNFTFQEAVDLAGALEPTLAVPMHYDMFEGNTERVERFVEYLEAKYPGIPTWVGRAGERASLRASRD